MFLSPVYSRCKWKKYKKIPSERDTKWKKYKLKKIQSERNTKYTHKIAQNMQMRMIEQDEFYQVNYPSMSIGVVSLW